MSSIVVLQARTSSSRLPAKVLLPVAGVPLAILAAKRAANTGRSILVVTSDDPTDDGLAATLESWQLPYFRGSLADPLSRIVSALTDQSDETVVIRLTADNVLPDGGLLDELVADFINQRLNYLCCNGVPSGLPYGLSAELTYLKHLREADKQAHTADEREHVTPYIIQKFGQTYFTKYEHLKQGYLRCTVDYFEDYISIQKLFSNYPDPVQPASIKLVKDLADQSSPSHLEQGQKLVLGTAQLGLQYGVNNATGKPQREQSQRIIELAIAHGVRCLDTARVYGNSEEVIGQSIPSQWRDHVEVITKLATLSDLSDNPKDSEIDAFVEASIFRSSWSLKQEKLDTVLLHRVYHLDAYNGYILKKLCRLKALGIIKKLGASVQSPQELERALREPEVQHIQMPFNLLDHRWHSSINMIEKAKAQRSLTIHVRSIFLQGLLWSEDISLWKSIGAEEHINALHWLQAMVVDCERKNIGDLCLAYVRSQPWVDGIVIGMENLAQLKENLHAFTYALLEPSQLKMIEKTRPKLPNAVLDPSQWKSL